MERKIQMTPLKIEILLHYFYSTDDFPNIEQFGIREAIDEFCDAGILRHSKVEGKAKVGVEEALEVNVEALK